MATDHRSRLREIRTFRQLVAYLRDEMGWPIGSEDFEDLTFEYTPEELGIDAKNAAKIQEIKRLRPLTPNQPWGIFFVKFEPKRLPIVALRRILSQVAVKKRASANSAERQAWAADDLLFVSNYGEGDKRQITFAHFSKAGDGHDLPTLKVLGWDNLDTPLHLDDVAEKLAQHLAWPDDDADADAWRERWRGAFTLRHREVITTSKELSLRLAELARAIRDRVKTALAIETETGPLTKLMKAFQEALVHDLDADGFADMYAQTIAYGLLSARIADPERKTADDFAGHMRTNPFLKELMETFLRVGGRRGQVGRPGIDFDELGVSEVVELLDDAKMEAVVRDFGDRAPQEDPVIHFYEHFLAAYDKKQKVQRGVFYTPRPVVSYIVRSVDGLLRTEFGLEDGLADTTTWGEIAMRHEGLEIPEGISPDHAFVQILDPACGTGTFLVEVIGLIHKTLVEKWEAEGHGEEKIRALWNEYVPEHLLSRVHGYELLMAPYAIAHLKIGLKLYETGYRFGNDERARVYLTNALEPASDKQLTLDFLPALAREAQAVNEIKRKQRFTVLIGNPPYSISSQNAGPWIVELLSTYKAAVRHERNIQPLSDDYVKFFRLAQFCIQSAGGGILSFISNHTFISGLIHRGMREELLRGFTSWYALDLNGSALLGLATPDGEPDQNVFDIQQGVAISLGCKYPWERQHVCNVVSHFSLWGSREDKYRFLSQHKSTDLEYRVVHPLPPNFFFYPAQARSETYDRWVSLQDVFGSCSTGFETGRDETLISFSREQLERFCRDLTSEAFSARDLFDRYGIRDTSGWPVCARREEVLSRGRKALLESIRVIQYRPFDVRFAPYCSFLRRAQFESMRHMIEPNIGLVATRMVKGESPAHFYVTSNPIEKILISPKTSNNAFLFPLYRYPEEEPQAGTLSLDEPRERELNLKSGFLEALAEQIGEETSSVQGLLREVSPDEIFAYIYAVFHSPAYRSRYAEFLKIDFPRVPLPDGLDLLRRLARLGDELVALHLMESKKLDHFITTYTGPVTPEVRRVGWSEDTVWLDARKTVAREGHRASKSGTIGFKGVLEEVWDFHIGGYQVLYKWLKERRGRTLSDDELAHYQKIVVALRETIRIMHEIDEVIEAHGGWPGAFQTAKASEERAERVLKVAEPRAEYRSERGKRK